MLTNVQFKNESTAPRHTHYNSRLKETSIYDLPETELFQLVRHYSNLAATISSYVRAEILHQCI